MRSTPVVAQFVGCESRSDGHIGTEHGLRKAIGQAQILADHTDMGTPDDIANEVLTRHQMRSIAFNVAVIRVPVISKLGKLGSRNRFPNRGLPGWFER